MANNCPYLRSSSDRREYLTYPTYQNRCYITGQGKPIPITIQTRFCLSGQSASCPIMRSSGVASDDRASPPTEIPAEKKRQRQAEEQRHLLARVREAETLPISAKRRKVTSSTAPGAEKRLSGSEGTPLAHKGEEKREEKGLRAVKAKPPDRRLRYIVAALALASGLALLLCLGYALIYIYLGPGFIDIGDLALATRTPTLTLLPTSKPPATPSPTSMPTAIAVLPSLTPTPALTPMPTDTPLSIPTSTPTSTSTDTPTPTITPTQTPTPDALATLTAEARIQEAARATMTAQAPTPTYTPMPTDTPTPPPTSAPLSTPTSKPIPATSPPTRIVAPSIGLDAKVIEVSWGSAERDGRIVTVWEVADYMAGWHKGSAYPGNTGNIVISGHHNIKGEVFRYVVDLKAGDEIYVFVGDVVYTYLVESNLILPDKNVPIEQRRENAKWIAPTNDERLTLVTCWPYTNNTHRVVVVAKPYTVVEYSFQPSD